MREFVEDLLREFVEDLLREFVEDLVREFVEDLLRKPASQDNDWSVTVVNDKLSQYFS